MPLFNIARGKIGYYCGLPAANDQIIAVLFQSAGQVSDDAMADFASLAAIKASQTEATFTNYARKTTANVVYAINNTTNVATADCDDLAYSAAGGTTNNTLGRIVFCYDPDTTAAAHDASIIPLVFQPYVTTTDGTTRTVQLNAAGFWRSREP